MNSTSDVNRTARYDNIDLMEAVAMLMVISYHMTSDLMTVNADILGAPSAASYINYIVMSVLSVCVPVFFFSNGFLLINKPLDLKKHLLKMLRLAVLAIIWAFIDSFAVMAITGEWVGPKTFLHNIWDMKIGWMHHLWFLGALLCVYVFLPVIKAALEKSVKIFNYWVAVCVIFIMGNMLIVEALRIAGYVITGRSLFITDNIFHIINPFRGVYGQAFLYFAIGSFVGVHREKIQKFTDGKRYINTFTLTAVLIISTVLLGLYGIYVCKLSGIYFDHVFGGYNTVFTGINVLVLYELCRRYKYRDNLICRYIRAVSSCSLGIYLMHIIFLAAVQTSGLTDLAIAKNWLFNIICSFVIMTVCLAIVQIMKKIPGIRKLVQ